MQGSYCSLARVRRNLAALHWSATDWVEGRSEETLEPLPGFHSQGGAAKRPADTGFQRNMSEIRRQFLIAVQSAQPLGHDKIHQLAFDGFRHLLVAKPLARRPRNPDIFKRLKHLPAIGHHELTTVFYLVLGRVRVLHIGGFDDVSAAHLGTRMCLQTLLARYVEQRGRT